MLSNKRVNKLECVDKRKGVKLSPMWKLRTPATARDFFPTSSSILPTSFCHIRGIFPHIPLYSSSEDMHLPFTKSEAFRHLLANNHLCGHASFSPIGSSTRSAYQPFLFPKDFAINFSSALSASCEPSQPRNARVLYMRHFTPFLAVVWIRAQDWADWVEVQST